MPNRNKKPTVDLRKLSDAEVQAKLAELRKNVATHLAELERRRGGTKKG